MDADTYMIPEALKALTPIYLASLGFFLALAALLAPTPSTELKLSVLGVGATAIGAAGGLAQQSKQQTIQGNEEVNIEDKP